MIRYATIAGAIALWMAPALSLCSVPSGLDCYLVQMHLHGHSNHNGNDLPASMAWHCSQAGSLGFDVIWWSDHSEIFDTYEDMRISLGYAMFDAKERTFDLARTRSRRRLSSILLEGPDEGITVNTGAQGIDVTVASRGGGGYDVARLTPVSERGPIKTLDWCRPLTSGLRLVAVMDASGLGEDAYLRLGFDLAAHPGGRQHLLFDIVPGQDSQPEVYGDTLVVQRMGVSGFPARLSFDLEKAAAHLPDGYDNTLSSVSIEFGARNGATVTVSLDSLILISDRPAGENQYRVVTRLAGRYDERYGITEYIGVEAGGMHTPERPHMNAFFPESTETFANLVIDPMMDRQDWAAGVHRRGGLVSLNHPFGASLNPIARGLYADAATVSLKELARTAGPIPEQDLWAVAGPIISTGGLGCDMLEVGYIFRGTGSLDDHLRLWDLVLAHGIRLVGTGVSDAHGGVWGPDLRPNPFASWIWAEAKDRDSLLRALKSGRVCFGDPFLWNGRFAFGVGGAFMGDTLYVKSGQEPRAFMLMEPWVNGADVRLVQVRLKAGREPEYIRRESIENARGGFRIRVDEPCFARLEVYGPDGDALVFSNPVWLIPR
jgi:hypothetical protein